MAAPFRSPPGLGLPFGERNTRFRLGACDRSMACAKAQVDSAQIQKWEPET
jgi:hypothetical protein